ncbi:hypothetical protein EPO33_04630 [Patescibacteria group bacterium]|nr:MAG: hypothetical protein EPO33_04630 [Patescibacteria group bacterium]
MPQEQIDAVRREMRRDLAIARELPSAAGLALAVRGLLAPLHSALVSETRIYVLKGRKVVTVLVVEPEMLALADDLIEQSEKGSGIFSTDGQRSSDTFTCALQDDAVPGLKSLSIPNGCLEVFEAAWKCDRYHHDFAPQLARLRRRSYTIDRTVFLRHTSLSPETASVCYAHGNFRFAVLDGRMVACVVV